MKSPLQVVLIFITLALTIYFAIIFFKFPLVGIQVEEHNDYIVVSGIYDNSWTSTKKIEIGDLIQSIDGKKPSEHETVKWFNRVEMANTFVVLDKNLQSQKFTVSNSSRSFQDEFFLLTAGLFNFTTLAFSIFLYLKTKKNTLSVTVLIYFLLSLGLCYFSSHASARGDMIGRVVNIITLTGSLILFIHFLRNYFLKHHLQFIKINSLKLLYVLYVVVVSIAISEVLFYRGAVQSGTIQLLFFSFSLFYLLISLTKFYIKYEKSVGYILKILLVALALALSPSVLFYAVPTIFLKNELLSAEITALFLIIIPITMLYLQFTTRILDIDFILNKLEYYALLSFTFAILIVFFLGSIGDNNFFTYKNIMVVFILFMITMVSLYIKEYIDYKFSRNLFLQKNNLEINLSTFFQKVKHEVKVEDFILKLISEIEEVLPTKEIHYLEIIDKDCTNIWAVKDNTNLSKSLLETIENINWSKYSVGYSFEIIDDFGIIISEENFKKSIIICKKILYKKNLTIQEKIRLETIAYFSNILMENFQTIEDLFKKIENYKQINTVKDNHPQWFSKLMFSLSEKERTNLSMDLHDSVLQGQLQLVRNIQMIEKKVANESLKNDLFQLKESILDNIHLIRDTCNSLRPPLLNEGLIPTIENLIEHTKFHCDFMLHYELDSSIYGLNKDWELTLYRSVQELLHNAMKHSLASEVRISLFKGKQTILLLYTDNGKGIDLTTLNDSFQTMGIFGMRERVKSIGGQIEMLSSIGNGLKVQIELEIGATAND